MGQTIESKVTIETRGAMGVVKGYNKLYPFKSQKGQVPIGRHFANCKLGLKVKSSSGATHLDQQRELTPQLESSSSPIVSKT